MVCFIWRAPELPRRWGGSGEVRKQGTQRPWKSLRTFYFCRCAFKCLKCVFWSLHTKAIQRVEQVFLDTGSLILHVAIKCMWAVFNFPACLQSHPDLVDRSLIFVVRNEVKVFPTQHSRYDLLRTTNCGPRTSFNESLGPKLCFRISSGANLGWKSGSIRNRISDSYCTICHTRIHHLQLGTRWFVDWDFMGIVDHSPQQFEWPL
jgi:hypothetical protein